MSVHEHEHAARQDRGDSAVAAAIITISDTRTLEQDDSGETIVKLLSEADHRVIRRTLVRDEPDDIRAAIADAAADSGVEVILLTERPFRLKNRYPGLKCHRGSF